MISCPLCHSEAPTIFVERGRKIYFRCPVCSLVFVDPAELPSAQTEKAQYDHHQNELDDPGYRRFLTQLSEPLIGKLRQQKHGLDYGCGPGPALVAMMEEAGYPCVGYDPLYANDTALLRTRYDFITCTEVVEHFHQPGNEFDRLTGLLKPGGWLAIMTSWYPPRSDFPNWHYHRDPTHVCFYCPDTFKWLARHHQLELEMPAQNISLLRAPY